MSHLSSDLALLKAYYEDAGFTIPKLTPIEFADIPAEYRVLLVHESKMTPTLEAFYQDDTYLETLASKQHHDYLSRQILLKLKTTHHIVEYGMITIVLKHLPAGIRQQVLETNIPFGRILMDHGMTTFCRPHCYYSLPADKELAEILGLQEGTTLYGRSNHIIDEQGQPLAEVVELLPGIVNVQGSATKLTIVKK